MKKSLLRFAAVIVLCQVSPAQSQTTSRRELRAERAEGIKLDGRLDEPAWNRAESGSDFVQRYPDPGKAATMRTEVRVLYDESAIYVAARMFDPHPDSIAAPLGRRDPGDVTSDWIDVIFDSYNDRRTAYRFGVNPAGTKLDVYHFNDSDDDVSWDALWDVATRIDSLGWVAEFRIPLSQLRFHPVEGDRVWGLQFYRAVARRDEWSFWSPYAPSMPGFVSAMGMLRGLNGIKQSAAIELTPYVSSQVMTRQTSAGDPFGDANRFRNAAGVDFRVGLGSALSLTGAINPDFGQVEVDPAVINLSAAETFVEEKRPFFLEGSGIFNFGALPLDASLSYSQFIHWRRIGRAPQLFPDGEWSDMPEQTTILGAAKVSGQIAGGWSLGAAEVLTQRENARVVDASGARSTQLVEPLSNYFVGRAKRDFNEGRATLGFLGTSVNRSLEGESRSQLRNGAYLLGVDATAATRDRRITLGGFFTQSLVTGSTSAIAATQLSSVRYFQRPDQDRVRFDADRNELTGHDAAVGVVYRGEPWFGSAQIREITPGYEANDLGFQSRADIRTGTIAFGGERNSSMNTIRSLRATAYGLGGWNFDGDRVYARTGFTSSAQLSSFWNLSLRGSVRPSLIADQLTRGGPAISVPRQVEAGGSISTDSRREWTFGVTGSFADKAGRGTDRSIAGSVRFRPSPSIDISVAPTLDLFRDGAQYIRAVADPLATATFGARYVFATIRQRTLSIDGRADWIFTPTLSFQLFAQPFVSTARFAGYKEVRTTREYDFAEYGRDAGTISRESNGRFTIDPDGAGTASPFQIGDRFGESSFVTRALRVNAVLRWEYRGGSALYAVWQQTRDGAGLIGDDYSDADIGRLLDVPARNVFLIKASYRIGR